jgi:hypothetical protein
MEFFFICNIWKVREREAKGETNYPLKACGRRDVYISNLTLLLHFLLLLYLLWTGMPVCLGV